MDNSVKIIKGRGINSKIDARYLEYTRQDINDGWMTSEDSNPVKTHVTVEKPKSIISKNNSPDIPFKLSINPYRGCEHGCAYCYARPTHAYLDLSPGLDFETRLFAKPDAARLLKKEINRHGYQCSPIALGTNTDPYQPIEREWKITRDIINVLSEHDHPLTIVTKSWLVERDIDLLAAMAKKNLVQVFLSVTTLNHDLARKLEPRTTAPKRRLQTLEKLSASGIPAGVMFAPVIPVLNDYEMEKILELAATAGVTSAGYVMIRLPHEIKDLFKSWLNTHEALKANHIMNLIRDIRGGRENDPDFGSRMRGKGAYADLIRQRFNQACEKLNLNKNNVHLNTDLFNSRNLAGDQISLF